MTFAEDMTELKGLEAITANMILLRAATQRTYLEHLIKLEGDNKDVT